MAAPLSSWLAFEWLRPPLLLLLPLRPAQPQPNVNIHLTFETRVCVCECGLKLLTLIYFLRTDLRDRKLDFEFGFWLLELCYYCHSSMLIEL